MTDPVPLVFDTGPLRHFAINGWLGVLKFLTSETSAVIPESVEAELKRQCIDIPALRQVLDAEWITVDRSVDLAVIAAFAGYEERLVEHGRNRGECGVLALGKVRGWGLVIDDRTARSIAKEDGLRPQATLSLLCDAIREGKLTVPMVEALADDLISGEYHLPFGPGAFRQWALQEGLIDYSD